MIDAIDKFLLDRTDEYLSIWIDWLNFTKKRTILTHLTVASVCSIYYDIINKMFGYVWIEVIVYSILFLAFSISTGTYTKPFRIAISALNFLGLVLMFTPPRRKEDILMIVYHAIWVVIPYLCASDYDGERGKKAKMAWNKIKELFGTDWQVEPLKTPS